MKELQNFSKEFQKELNWQIKSETYKRSKESILINHMLLTTEISEIAELFRKLFEQTEFRINNGESELDVFEEVKKSVSEDLGREISDCIAYLCKFANYFERDIERDFYEKMELIKERKKLKYVER